MSPGGETVTLTSNFGSMGGGFGGYGSMLSSMPPRLMNSLPKQHHLYNNHPLSNLSLAPLGDVDAFQYDLPSSGGEGGGYYFLGDGGSSAQTVENNETMTMMARREQNQSHHHQQQQQQLKEEESDDKFSSDNPEGGGSGDELLQDGDGAGAGDEDEEDASGRPKKKRYHRHTLHQINEMERFFKECPHPDEKQRQELGRELKLSTRQIKFWFQNKRTKMKVHHERHDNGVLRSDNEKLKAENFALRDAVRNLACPNCGGPANLTEMSFDEQQLRIENVRLREEIDRITAMAAKYIGRQGAMSEMSPSRSHASGLDVLQGSNALPPPASDHNQLFESASNSIIGVPDLAATARSYPLTEVEKPLVVELAVASMEELLQVSQAGEPLWTYDPNNPSSEIIDHDVYLQRFQRGIGPTPVGLKPDTSRHTGLVIMNSKSLIETFMDVNRWAEMFPSIISRAEALEMLSTGVAGSYDGAIQLMYAEFQVSSPLVPTREFYFLRYCKRVDHLWVIVDVSVDSLRANPNSPTPLRCRRRPSGCIIEEMPSGYSKVSWVEHTEAPTSAVHGLYKSLVNSGMAFGALRWLCSLQRQCERIASVLANVPPRDMSVIPNPEGRRSMLKLSERMTNNFCSGVSASTSHTWVTLAGSNNGGGADDVRVLIRKSVDDPGRPPGIVLSAATSLWLPVPPAQVFNFLRDERFRTEWDILSNTGVVEEMFHLAKGQDPGNSVSLLRVNPIAANQSNMLILQECCTDEACSLVVYAPVDIAAMSTVLNGGDPHSVALLPSGFAILPDGQPCGAGAAGNAGGGSLLTVAFQILVDHVPTARLSLGSVATVNKLISNTVVRIRSALA